MSDRINKKFFLHAFICLYIKMLNNTIIKQAEVELKLTQAEAVRLQFSKQMI